MKGMATLPKTMRSLEPDKIETFKFVGWRACVQVNQALLHRKEDPHFQNSVESQLANFKQDHASSSSDRGFYPERIIHNWCLSILPGSINGLAYESTGPAELHASDVPPPSRGLARHRLCQPRVDALRWPARHRLRVRILLGDRTHLYRRDCRSEN